MDEIPMQTLKRPVEKPNPEIVIEEIALKLKNVRNTFKPTVSTRRVLKIDYDDDDINQEEKKMSIKEQEEEIERLSHFFPLTRDLLRSEIKGYKNVFDSAINDYEHKNEYNKKDQNDLKKSDQILDKKMSRFMRLENIKKALDEEIKVSFKND